MNSKNTEEMTSALKDCKDISEFLKENEENIIFKPFEMYMNELLEKYGMTRAKLIEDSDFSKATIYKGISEERRIKQNVVLQIGLRMGVTLDEMQRMLKLSHNEELYVKNKRDCIIMWGIENGIKAYDIDEELEKANIDFRICKAD